MTSPKPGARRLGAALLGGWLAASICVSLAARGPAEAPGPAAAKAAQPALEERGSQEPGSDGCLVCHHGIEDMHPAARLSCVDCHGGDATGRTTKLAHVQPALARGEDERVAPEDEDLAYRRFVNPMDLRVAHRVCGDCHRELVEHLRFSLHGTTAGHVSDGFYEMGITPERGSRFAVFPVSRTATEKGEVERLLQAPAFDPMADPAELRTHFPDLVRKECMQCHLYSKGRAVRGRVGFDGDYRGEGCAACHVEYALSGLSDSADRSARRTEPGHPARHAMTRAPSTQTCTSCHYGDASIGLQFRGLSQLPPGAPGGPEIPGTTDRLLNRSYYLDDPAMCPPDVHHERGMHCIDCHTLSDVMGDGALHGQMEHAVEISCEACHGTFTERSKLVTERGTPLPQLFEERGDVWLRSKVTGALHKVKQVVDVVSPTSIDYVPEAARAMTGAHSNVECYTCHSGWNANFLGFHFYRNAALSQLDLISGKRTPGRVTTQEKVFATWKSFYAGLNESGRVAPYLTGFSTMGTVDGEDGTRLLDQVMPVTAEGLSGMTMIHHQLHSVRPTARQCVECHRSSGTWGMGTSNFRLARRIAYIADRRGIEVVALDRANLTASTPLAKFVLPDIVDLELDCDPLQGHARFLYASEGGRGIHVIDVRDPRRPKRVAFVECVSPRGMALAGDHLYVADGVGGLRAFDVSEPAAIHRVGVVPMFDAHEVEIRWPWAYVADGPGGLAIVDIRAPIAPRVVGGVRVSQRRGGSDMAIDLDVLFQNSRPQVTAAGTPADWRSEARNLCALVDEREGLVMIDVTEPTNPVVLWPARDGPRTTAPGRREVRWRAVTLRSKLELASPQGGDSTREIDAAYVLEEQLLENGDGRSFLNVLDVTNPSLPIRTERVRAGDQSESLTHAAFYNQPFLQPIALIAANDGLYAMDVSSSARPNPVGVLPGLLDTYVMAIEEFPLDAMLDESGKRLKDVSHEGSRWLFRAEIDHVLSVAADALGLALPGESPPPPPGDSARAFFARHDADRDGLLTGTERTRAGEAFDRNGDGRVTLAEVAEQAGSLVVGEGTRARVREAEPPVQFKSERVGYDGDLARLFDGLDPREFDKDRDSRLDRKEASRALFAALDLDGDERLDRAELSRHPGRLRQIRYADLGGLELFKARDLNRGGTIGPRELEIQDAEWEALDTDGDGEVQLAIPLDSGTRRSGAAPPPSEWPVRRPVVIGLPPGADAEKLLAFFDKSGDGAVSKRELKSRPDLYTELDADLDSLIQRDELGRGAALVGRFGVGAVRDLFLERWDLDGDGRVDAAELPEAAATVLRQRGLLGARR